LSYEVTNVTCLPKQISISVSQYKAVVNPLEDKKLIRRQNAHQKKKKTNYCKTTNNTCSLPSGEQSSCFSDISCKECPTNFSGNAVAQLIRMKLEDTTVKNFDQPTIHWNNSADDNDYCFKHCDHVAVMCPCNDDDCSCYVVRSFCFDVDGCYLFC
ncbi:hypothetical protein T02_8551, partial [Trichinella nativa]